jgi:predicted porin
MQKKLIAVAVAGALAAPAVAFAQASTVQIYGAIIVNYMHLNSGGDKGNTDMLNSHDAGMGFKGEERLGGGLSSWFQCESTFDVTGGLGQWCGRNSAVGFKGGFGNVYVGNWDTPMKIAMGKLRPFSTSGIYGMGDLLWGGVQSNVLNTGASMTRRHRNLISYASPSMSGFDLGFAYSAANEATAQSNNANARKPRLWGIGASYATGPLYFGIGYESHSNFNPAGLAAAAYGTGSSSRGWSAGAAYTFAGRYKVSFIYTDNDWGVTPTTNLTKKSWGIYGDLDLAGPHRVRLGYSVAGDSKGTSASAVGPHAASGANTGGKLYAIQYAYAFSKRTELNFGYAKVNNDTSSMYVLRSAGSAPFAPQNVGFSQSAFQLGVVHRF